MENMVTPFPPTPAFWQGKRVFLTGHTGFKGGWLALWLHRLGAMIHGYALDPPTEKNLFTTARIDTLLEHEQGDLRDARHLAVSLAAFAPDVAFHLAAQPLVRRSYREPVDTFAVNIQGTVHFLEACRNIPSLQAVVVITTDKCYANREWVHPYRESDRLGGHDPYSASKACAELVCASYRDAFFLPENGPRLATARAGNVVGGGDWGEDRLIPDAVRAFSHGRPLELRAPESVRPWQHVLDPLRGYLLLARSLVENGPSSAQAINFGPPTDQNVSVRRVVDIFVQAWGPGAGYTVSSPRHIQPHEAGLLRLDTSLARHALGWIPLIPLDLALRETAVWYQRHAEQATPAQLRALMEDQITRLVGTGDSAAPVGP